MYFGSYCVFLLILLLLLLILFAFLADTQQVCLADIVRFSLAAIDCVYDNNTIMQIKAENLVPLCLLLLLFLLFSSIRTINMDFLADI